MDTFDLPDASLAQLSAYADAVRSSPHNLLSKRAMLELWDRHIRESVVFARSLPSGGEEGLKVLDLGTGGGLPGMVVAIVRPDLQVTLLDATAKKMEFLRAIADDLSVDVGTVTGRAEDLAREHASSFDIVTARAVAALDQLVAWAMPFVRPGGQLHAIKGERWRDELQAALPAIERCRGTVVGVPGVVQQPDDGRPAAMQTPDPASDPKVVIIQAAG